ncbi:MAG: 16S rRNA (uracil(1498)-N(3))-methyltransferase [Candidatus Andeanibacterium colombiense]|uniref:Ribosomal RNA small subunit methyltransferase E n=1 Tax=Candidatus Andeanibacterium colombiense TaxID=3121345 RepID=A0AAJ5X4C2_9SPHN|nr:MAG: 16S rRNA (uracil(1498)-N(3))-methyltransferase [Sphingomonadaceae bacterium]
MPATPAWPPKSAPRLFIPGPLAAGHTLALEGPQAHYLARVMRVAEGDAVILCDDLTGEWAARVTEAGKREVTLEVAERLRERQPVPDFTLCAALLKKDRFDWVLEKATELGVRRIQPVLTRRCVADKLNLERARAAIVEAAEQCARTALPELAEPVKLDALLKSWDASRALFFADEAGGEPAAEAFAEPLRRQGPQSDSRDTEGGARLRGDSLKAALLVGPEGGFDDAERAAIRVLSAAVPITLGPRILRGETAAISATAVWMALAGDWSQIA